MQCIGWFATPSETTKDSKTVTKTQVTHPSIDLSHKRPFGFSIVHETTDSPLNYLRIYRELQIAICAVWRWLQQLRLQKDKARDRGAVQHKPSAKQAFERTN